MYLFAYKIDDRKLNVCLAYGFFVMKNQSFAIPFLQIAEGWLFPKTRNPQNRRFKGFQDYLNDFQR